MRIISVSYKKDTIFLKFNLICVFAIINDLPIPSYELFIQKKEDLGEVVGGWRLLSDKKLTYAFSKFLSNLPDAVKKIRTK